jgi:hypothetical protein
VISVLHDADIPPGVESEPGTGPLPYGSKWIAVRKNGTVRLATYRNEASGKSTEHQEEAPGDDEDRYGDDEEVPKCGPDVPRSRSMSLQDR